MRSVLRISACISLFVGVLATIGCGGGSTATPQNPASQQVPTIAFSAKPSSITAGYSAVLSWTANNATSVDITGMGAFAANGSVKVTPSSTTTYTATAKGAGGTAESSATVTVVAAETPAQTSPPTISFQAQPSSVTSGATAVLSWTTT